MGRRRKLPQNTSSRDVHIRIKGQEHCILLDHNHFEKKTKGNSETLEQKY